MTRAAIHRFDRYDLIREIAERFEGDSPLGEIARQMLAEHAAPASAVSSEAKRPAGAPSSEERR